jgi:hypothetical protein
MEGDVVIEARDAGGSYILREGTYAAISPGAAGVPDEGAAAGGQLGAEHAATVRDVISEGEVQRQGQGAEIPLEVNDGINSGDVVQTLRRGRLRIALADGSILNIGSGSTMRIIRHDARAQRTEIQLTSGRMRVWPAKLVQPGASFKVQTPTAVAGLVGSDFIVEVLAEATRVYCIQGMVSIQNIDAAVAGQAILHPIEFTEVARGLPPAAPEGVTDTLLQAQINQTTVLPAGGRRAAAVGWHIGSLSEAESVGLVVGLAAGTAAAIAVPLITAAPPSKSGP